MKGLFQCPPWARSFWAFSPFLNHLQSSIQKKKSQYPADGAEYCDFTFLLYKSFLFDAFFYRLQYIVENLIGVAEGDEVALKLRWTYVDATIQHVRNFQDTKKSDQERFARYFRNMLDRGIYVSPSQFECNFISLCHTDEILDYVLKSIEESIE